MKTAAFSAAELRFEAGYPGPRICRTFTRKGAAVSSQGLPEIAGPLGGPPESRPRRWEFRTAKCESRPRRPDFFTAKRESRPPRPDFFTAKCESRPPRRTSSWRSGKADHAARTFSRRSGKADNGGRLCPGGAFSAARPAGTARFLITREKASFYETATFGRRKVFFCSPFCGLLFCPARAKLALPAGEKPAARNPGRPAAARPTTATGSRFLRRQRERPTRRPRPSPPAREGSLGAPNDRTFPPGAERKARKEKEKEEPRMKRVPPL